jgi:hypothetical protein
MQTPSNQIRNAAFYAQLVAYAALLAFFFGFLRLPGISYGRSFDIFSTAFGVLGLPVLLLTFKVKESRLQKAFFLLAGAAGTGVVVTLAVFALLSWAGHTPGGDGGGLTVPMLLGCPMAFLVGAVGALACLARGVRGGEVPPVAGGRPGEGGAAVAARLERVRGAALIAQIVFVLLVLLVCNFPRGRVFFWCLTACEGVLILAGLVVLVLTLRLREGRLPRLAFLLAGASAVGLPASFPVDWLLQFAARSLGQPPPFGRDGFVEFYALAVFPIAFLVGAAGGVACLVARKVAARRRGPGPAR